MSYLLCDQIRNNYGKCYENIFSMFKDFVEAYNNDTKSFVCSNQVEHLKEYEFIKMKTLYELYDIYMSLSPRHDLGSKNYCVVLLKLVHLYNSFLKKYRSDSSEFNNVLTDFHELMKTITNTGKAHCKDDYFYIGEPYLYTPEVVQIKDLYSTLSEKESKLSQEKSLDNT
ncbi:hypothetical protein PCYB_005360, partial [Plasmodium cynomolgi strain B]